MATSIAELIILCLVADVLLRRVAVPGLIGMLLVGVVLGPYVLGYIDDSLLVIGPDLRVIALVIILLRAGFALSRKALHQVGERVLLLAFVPATVEGLVITWVAQGLLGLSLMEAALLGFVVAAVSPAVIVPAMLRLMRHGRGGKKEIPTMILAASSVDDVYVIVVHSMILSVYVGLQTNVAWSLAGIPVSLLLGGAAGLGLGWMLTRLFRRYNPRATKRVLTVIAVAVMLLRIEELVAPSIPFAGLIAAMALGLMLLEQDEHAAHEISAKLAKIWIFAEIILFTLVGAQVNIHVAWDTGLAGVAVIACGLVGRSLATLACLIRSPLNAAERSFVVIAFFPKATVQAAIGAAPLLAMAAAGMNTAPGETILAVSVLSIVLTAPLGAWLIRWWGDRALAVDAPVTEDGGHADAELLE